MVIVNKDFTVESQYMLYAQRKVINLNANFCFCFRWNQMAEQLRNFDT